MFVFEPCCRAHIVLHTVLLCTRPVRAEVLSDTFVWRLSVDVAYIGPKSRTDRPRKTKIGTEVAHVTCDSDTTFKIKRSKVKVTRPVYSPRRLRKGSDELQAWYRDGVQWTASLTCSVTSKTHTHNGTWRQALHHLHARWPTSWKPCVAVQVTICRGRGHIVAAALQAT